MKYSALYSLYIHAKDKEAVLTDLPYLDRQAWGSIECLRAYRQFDMWWLDLGNVHRDVAFDEIKKVLKKG